MTKVRALVLIFAGGLTLEIVAILVLARLGANDAALTLGLVVPLVLMSYLSSGVVMRYGATGRRDR